MREYHGTTEGAGSAILGSPFWNEGTQVAGVYVRTWDSKIGECYEFTVPPGQPQPIAFIGEDGRVTEQGSRGAKEVQLAKFSIGALKGFQMAIQELEAQGIKFQFRDHVTVICTGFQESRESGMDDMIKFKITVRR